MKIKMSLSEMIFQILNNIFMLFVLAVTLYPVIYVVLASLSDGNRLLAHSGALLRPLGFSIDAYIKCFEDNSILHGYAVTLFVVAAGTSLNMILSIFASYFVSKKNVYAGKAVMFMMLFTMYFSGGMIPLYLTVKDLGLFNNILALIFPTAVNTYNVIVLRTAFVSLPGSMEEAARIDGAGTFTTLFRILVPLIKPTLAVIFLYYLVGHWNSWFNAMIFLQDENKFPLQLVLRRILIENTSSFMSMGVSDDNAYAVGESIKYAVIVISILPVLILYPFMQKYFAKGVMIGAVKG